MTESKLEPHEDILRNTTGRQQPAGKTANHCLRNLAVAFFAIGLAAGLSCEAKRTDCQPPEPPARISAEQVNQRKKPEELKPAREHLFETQAEPAESFREKEQADEEFDRGRRASKTRHFATAIRHWEKALAIYRTLPNTEREQAGCYGNIGATLLELGNYEEAFKNHKAALPLFVKVHETEREQAACHQNMGFSLMGVGRYQEAIDELNKALAMFEKLSGTEDKQVQCRLNIIWCEQARDSGIRVLP